MRIGYYPGCSLQGSGREYSESLFTVAEKCGVVLEEINDWNCCGASAAHSLNHDLSVALPARTLALAEKQGLEQILVHPSKIEYFVYLNRPQFLSAKKALIQLTGQ